jgi:hypothetical protein
MPANWQAVDMSEESLKGLSESFKSTDNTQFAGILDTLLASGQSDSFLLFAIGFDGEAMSGDLAVTAFPSNGWTIEGQVPFIDAQLRNMGAKHVTWSKTTLSAGDAATVDYDLDFNVGDGTAVNVPERMFAIAKDGFIYVATFACFKPRKLAACLANATIMADSLVIGS